MNERENIKDLQCLTILNNLVITNLLLIIFVGECTDSDSWTCLFSSSSKAFLSWEIIRNHVLPLQKETLFEGLILPGFSLY